MLQQLIEVFQPPTMTQLAIRELSEAQLSLLSSQSAAEYAINMVEYHKQRIERLQGVVASSNSKRK